MVNHKTRVLESFYRVERKKSKVDFKEERTWLVQNRKYLFDIKYKQAAWFKWLVDQNIMFTLDTEEVWDRQEVELLHDGKLRQYDLYSIYLNVLFTNRNDHLKFELVWKGRYDE